MKKCNSCGKECNDYENFCSNCGGSSFSMAEQYAPENTVNDNQNQYSDNQYTEAQPNNTYSDAQPNNTYNDNQYYNNQNTVNDNQFNNNSQYYNPYGNYQQPNQFNGYNYQQPNQFGDFDPQIKAEKSNIDDAKICGIVSLVIIFFGLVGLSWIPALIGNNKLKGVTQLRGSSEFDTARLLNKIGMILSIISIVLIVLLIIFYLILFSIGMTAAAF